MFCQGTLAGTGKALKRVLYTDNVRLLRSCGRVAGPTGSEVWVILF
jgi:hypothetical protein